MGKASSSKKVQRAARAAASSRGASERRELGFPFVIGLIVLLGVILVVVANREQDNQVKEVPLLTDHWHAAYSLYDCDDYLTPFQEAQNDPLGIHSHVDSLIHIHPFSSAVTGGGAQLGIFLEAMFASLDENALESREHGVLEAGSDCNGEPTVWQVGRFRIDPDVQLVETITSDFSSIQFDRDREAFTIARIPVGAEIPPPDQVALEQLDSITGGAVTSPGPVDVPLDGSDADADATDPEPETDAEVDETDPATDPEAETDTDAESG